MHIRECLLIFSNHVIACYSLCELTSPQVGISASCPVTKRGPVEAGSKVKSYRGPVMLRDEEMSKLWELESAANM